MTRPPGFAADRLRLSSRDLARLRAATGREVDPGSSLFGPGSVTWKVNREGILLVGGVRALLLQVAHPLVAAGVAAHSDFEKRPLERLWRTLDLTLAIVFDDAATAIRAVRQIEAVHERVRGALAEPVGPFRRGTPYVAEDPRLLFWVHATLVDSALVVYERFIGRLSRAERERYYQESKITARLFGIPDSLIPPDLAEFRRYFREMVRGSTLAVGSAGKSIAASILDPPLFPGPRQLAGALGTLSVGLLPAEIRRRYRLGWSGRRQRALDVLAAAARLGLPVLPSALRDFPRAHRALANPADPAAPLDRLVRFVARRLPLQ
jgi:uncharacterized protein (DUF2236 family)